MIGVDTLDDEGSAAGGSGGAPVTSQVGARAGSAAGEPSSGGSARASAAGSGGLLTTGPAVVAGHDCARVAATEVCPDGTPVPVCCAPSASESAYAASLVELLARERETAGVPAIVRDPALEAAAEANAIHRTHDPSAGEYVAIGGLETAPERAAQCGTSADTQASAELLEAEIASGTPDPAATLGAWLRWDPTRALLLDPRYTRAGVGYHHLTVVIDVGL